MTGPRGAISIVDIRFQMIKFLENHNDKNLKTSVITHNGLHLNEFGHAFVARSLLSFFEITELQDLDNGPLKNIHPQLLSGWSRDAAKNLSKLGMQKQSILNQGVEEDNVKEKTDGSSHDGATSLTTFKSSIEKNHQNNYEQENYVSSY